jgi:diguanylate cyclase (GGDEF)-like protein
LPTLPTLRMTRNSSGVFQQLMVAVSVIAAVAHLCFIMLFDAAGIRSMAQVNVASLLTYGLVLMLSLSGRPLVAVAVMATEVVAHGILAVWVIGWGSGFHFYIILIIPVAIVSTMSRVLTKAVLAVGTLALYVTLDVLFRDATPAYALPEATLKGLYYFNQVSTLAILGLLAGIYYQLVSSAEGRLRAQASTDPLTQLSNRRSAMDTAQREAGVFAAQGAPLALLIGDIDHFKRINDAHGHDAGDRALKAVAEVLRSEVRQVDHVARWGGEEFFVLLPGTDLAEAKLVAERLRASVQQLVLSDPDGRQARVTMTFGVSLLEPGEDVEHALARADRALYAGKENGRNRVIVASPLMEASHA